MSRRIVQMTDLHLFADPARTLKGVQTDASFRAVLARVQELAPVPDVVLLTGDLSQDESPQAYERLAETIAGLGSPVYWVPGNHDDAGLMDMHLAAAPLSARKSVGLGVWRLVLLNSQQPGSVGGWMSGDQLEFLGRELADAERNGQHALIALHHPPFPVGAAWIDRQRISNAEELVGALAGATVVGGVICGHVHQERQAQLRGIPCWTTPSTCFQFKPDQATFGLDTRAPGFRVLDLHDDGSIETRVERVAAACR